MDLKSLFKRLSPRASAASDDAVQQARTRARRRLMGAAVLLVTGVIAFPLLFETKPRPLPMDTPMAVAQKAAAVDSGAIAPSPAASTTPSAAALTTAAVTAAAVTAAAAVTPAPPPSSASSAGSRPQTLPASAPVAVKPAASQPNAPVPAKTLPKAEPKVEKKVVPADAKADAKAARFTVQVGAYADAAATREARSKAEKLGLKTYTQEVDTSAGKRTRVRVGPFKTREEAQQAAAKLRAANMPASVLTL